MNQPGFICLNGSFLRGNEPVLFHDNRAFRYGDALFEHIHAYATRPQFMDLHIDRLKSSMKLLSMEVPPFFTMQNFTSLIETLLNKNRFFGGAHIQLSVFRNAGGNYCPSDNRVSYMLESQALDHHFYELNTSGYTVDIFPDFAFPDHHSLASVRPAWGLPYIMAGIYSREKGLDDVILLNQSGKIIQTVHGNVFLIKDTALFTPGILQGCFSGIMRKVILEISEDTGFRINDQSNLTPAAMNDADEIFLTNTIEGIRWIGAFRQRRFYKKTAQALIRKLNERAFNL
jgi:branched-chain amino acid aminotransferase